MKHQLTALLIMTTLLIQAAPPTAPEFREGRYYEPNSETPFSGNFTRYNEKNHSKESEGKIKEGLMNGIWVFYFSNGNLKGTIEYVDGVKIKVLNSFYETGEKESEFDEDKQVFLPWKRNGKKNQ